MDDADVVVAPRPSALAGPSPLRAALEEDDDDAPTRAMPLLSAFWRNRDFSILALLSMVGDDVRRQSDSRRHVPPMECLAACRGHSADYWR